MTDSEHTRKDDAFLRRMTWLFLGLAVTSGGGWVYTIAKSQEKLENAIKRIDKLERIQAEISRSMSSIDKGVSILVALAEERNNQQGKILKKQEYIFNEQLSRTDEIEWVRRQMMAIR